MKVPCQRHQINIRCRWQRNGKNLLNSLKYKSYFVFLCMMMMMMMQQCCSARIQLTLEIRDTTKLKKTVLSSHVTLCVRCAISFQLKYLIEFKLAHLQRWAALLIVNMYTIWFFFFVILPFFNCNGMTYDPMCATIYIRTLFVHYFFYSFFTFIRFVFSFHIGYKVIGFPFIGYCIFRFFPCKHYEFVIHFPKFRTKQFICPLT